MWCIIFDNIKQDLSNEVNRKVVEDLVAEKCVEALGTAIFYCNSSRAIRPPSGTRMRPTGLPTLEGPMLERVKVGNPTLHDQLVSSPSACSAELFLGGEP